MRLNILLSLLLVGHFSTSQTFLDGYKNFRLDKIKTLNSAKKQVKQDDLKRILLLNKQIEQFDTIFKSYYGKTGFDFNNSDSLTIVYQTEIETNLSDYIIWAGKDTITYGESWFEETLHSRKKIIQYKPFLDTTQRPKGIKVIDERDSLMTLVSKKDCETAQRLSKENSVFDAMSSTIIFAKKIKGQFIITECHLQPFGFIPIWRKE